MRDSWRILGAYGLMGILCLAFVIFIQIAKAAIFVWVFRCGGE